MSDLISRQAAIDAPMERFKRVPTTAIIAKAVIENLPSAQPGIIRCKDCEHWDTSWETVYGLHYCPRIDMATNKNFFCKYGAKTRGDKHGN